jgi:hypothetical protein
MLQLENTIRILTEFCMHIASFDTPLHSLSLKCDIIHNENVKTNELLLYGHQCHDYNAVTRVTIRSAIFAKTNHRAMWGSLNVLDLPSRMLVSNLYRQTDSTEMALEDQRNKKKVYNGWYYVCVKLMWSQYAEYGWELHKNWIARCEKDLKQNRGRTKQGNETV